LYKSLSISTGGAGGRVVSYNAGVEGSIPTIYIFSLAPLSLLIGNLWGVIPGYAEKCACRWEYE